MPGASSRISLVISRADVENLDVGPALAVLTRLIESPTSALTHLESLDIGFDGFNADRRDIFEIPAVREYVFLLDGQFPYWLFFLCKRSRSLTALTLCFMPPYLTDQAKRNIYPPMLEELLSKRWLPAMNSVSAYAGLSESQIEDLTERVVLYFSNESLLG